MSFHLYTEPVFLSISLSLLVFPSSLRIWLNAKKSSSTESWTTDEMMKARARDEKSQVTKNLV